MGDESLSSSMEEDLNEKLLRTDLWEQLPDFLVERILVKLPVSSLFRFCWVCRKWRNFILTGYSALLLFKSDRLAVCRSNNDEEEAMSLDFLPVADRSSMNLIASAGGLLCFSTNIGGELVICNPLTKRYKKLPIPHADIENVLIPFSLYFGSQLRGTVFVDMVLNSDMKPGFKLVIASINPSFSRDITAVLYDSVLNSWKRVADLPPSVASFLTDPVIWQGNLYCIVQDKASTFKLLEFDVQMETWKVNPLPEETGLNSKLVEYDGNIVLIQLTKGDDGMTHLICYRLMLEDPSAESMYWMPLNLSHLTSLLRPVSVAVPKAPKMIYACWGKDGVICFLCEVERLGLGVSRLRAWVHTFSTNIDIVTDIPVEFSNCTLMIFKPSLRLCS